MSKCITVLRGRSSEICGVSVDNAESAHLAHLSPTPITALLSRVYEGFPVCGMRVGFAADSTGRVYIGEDDSDDYHEFYWQSPSQISDEMVASRVGPSVQAAGYVLVGKCAFGGDPYFLKESESPGDPSLYRIYYDWVDPEDPTPLVPEAVALVASRLSDVLTIASFMTGA